MFLNMEDIFSDLTLLENLKAIAEILVIDR